jgi:hypothetical protein
MGTKLHRNQIQDFEIKVLNWHLGKAHRRVAKWHAGKFTESGLAF